MESAQPLVYLTTVVGTVAGHLVVGRLRAEGIAACASGPVDGPYPFPIEIDVLVPADELARDRKSTRLNSSHPSLSRMPSSA